MWHLIHSSSRLGQGLEKLPCYLGRVAWYFTKCKCKTELLELCSLPWHCAGVHGRDLVLLRGKWWNLGPHCATRFSDIPQTGDSHTMNVINVFTLLKSLYLGLKRNHLRKRNTDCKTYGAYKSVKVLKRSDIQYWWPQDQEVSSSFWW